MKMPEINLLVLPGSLFCTKVMCALNHLGLPYTLTSVQLSKLKKQLPAPHLVPVMEYNDKVIADSSEILKFLHLHHADSNRQLYPDVSAGAAKYRYWSSVEKLEKFAHDSLSMYYYFFAAVSEYGIQNVTKPYMKLVLPKSLTKAMPFLPSLASRANAFSLRRRVTPLLGADTIATEEIAQVGLLTSLRRLEKCFENDEQQYFFATAGPSAADFGIFAALKRLMHPIPELSPAFAAGYPNCLRDAGDLRRLQAFFDHMNEKYYRGKIDWSCVPLRL